jgi:hypothetical protein
MPRWWIGLATALALSATPRLEAQHTGGAPSVRDVSRAADSAYRARDFGRYRRHALTLRRLRPYDPDMVLMAARANALAGRPIEALRHLEAYARRGVLADITSDPDFSSLRSHPQLAAILRRLARNGERISPGDTAFVIGEADLLAEDVAYDPFRRAFLLGSLRKRRIVRIDSSGRAADFLASRVDVWAVPALAIDSGSRILWAGTGSNPVQEGGESSTAGRSALVALSLDDGRVLRRLEAPADGKKHYFGDITVDGGGAVYASDAETSTLYRARPGIDSLETFLPGGVLRAPQSPTVSPVDGRLYVADYARGIYSADRATARGRWLVHPDTLTLTGIDGLYACGRGLVAVQNGTRPMRVLWLELDPRTPSVRSWRVLAANDPVLDEPTHGTMVGRSFYLIANNQAYRYYRAGPDATKVVTDPQVVMRLAVPC